MSRLKISSRTHVARRPTTPLGAVRGKSLVRTGVLALVAAAAGCAASAPVIPPPRPIVIHSGVRIRADHERMKEVNEWVTRENRNIEQDPSFWIITDGTIDEVFPWEGLYLSEASDTAIVQMPLGGRDAELVYVIYGHLRLMAQRGGEAKAEWLPEAAEVEGYELERAILKRTADAWVLGRTVFDTQPFGPMDELIYASEAGYLDAFLFTARPNEFASARSAWVRENPGVMDEYREWFLDTFSREPPGLRPGE